MQMELEMELKGEDMDLEEEFFSVQHPQY